MLVPKIFAGLILLIMAGTWSYLSCTMGVMVAVSDNFMYLALTLASVVFGGGIGDILQRFGGKGGKS